MRNASSLTDILRGRFGKKSKTARRGALLALRVGVKPFSNRTMESHSKFAAGHPLHPVLITLPLGLLSASLFFDFKAKLQHKSDDAKIARALIGGGILTGLLAAAVGLIDYRAIPNGTRAKQIGLTHAVGNVLMLSLFGLSWLKRRPDETAPATSAVVLSLLGAALSGLTGWLGGELVYRLGVGVDPGANLDAKSSLVSDKP